MDEPIYDGAVLLTPPSAHPALQAASDYGMACYEFAKAKMGTTGYSEALGRCNEAWERIAVACGVSPSDSRTSDQNHQYLPE
jgi:hypothetical protein